MYMHVNLLFSLMKLSKALDPVQTKVIPTKGSSLQAYEENIESNHLGSGEDYDVHINGIYDNLKLV